MTWTNILNKRACSYVQCWFLLVKVYMLLECNRHEGNMLQKLSIISALIFTYYVCFWENVQYSQNYAPCTWIKQGVYPELDIPFNINAWFIGLFTHEFISVKFINLFWFRIPKGWSNNLWSMVAWRSCRLIIQRSQDREWYIANLQMVKLLQPKIWFYDYDYALGLESRANRWPR